MRPVVPHVGVGRQDALPFNRPRVLLSGPRPDPRRAGQHDALDGVSIH